MMTTKRDSWSRTMHFQMPDGWTTTLARVPGKLFEREFVGTDGVSVFTW